MSEKKFLQVLDASPSAGLWIGAKGGRAALEALLPLLEGVDPSPSIVALDFSSVKLLTASAVRTGALPLLSALLERKHCGVMVNVAEDALDEIQLAAEASKAVIVCADLSANGLTNGAVLGFLDLKLRETLTHMVALGEADAKGISERSGAQIVVTVWNNRLVSLQALGLATERRVGRTKMYAPIVKGMTYGR